MTSIPRSGRYCTTGAPTPAVAAGAALACSASRSMPSSPASLDEQRTTRSRGGPSSSLTTRTLWLVSPPGRSVACQDSPARVARRSRGNISGGLVDLGHGRVDVLDRPGEPLLGGGMPPQGEQEHRADSDD